MELGKGGCCIDSGEARIRQLGYKQELARNFGLLSNASIGFTAISILTGITGAPAVQPRRRPFLPCTCEQAFPASQLAHHQIAGHPCCFLQFALMLFIFSRPEASLALKKQMVEAVCAE